MEFVENTPDTLHIVIGGEKLPFLKAQEKMSKIR